MTANSKDPDQPAEIYSLIRNFAILCYVLLYSMILYADSESPDQTARMCRLIWTFAVRICPKNVFAQHGPFGNQLCFIDIIELAMLASTEEWSGVANVSSILHHRGVQLILAYSWARPVILVAGKGRGGMFLFLLFLHFHSCSSLFPIPLSSPLLSPLSLFSFFGRRLKMTHND